MKKREKTIELDEDVFQEVEIQAKKNNVSNEEMVEIALENLKKVLNAKKWMEEFGKAAMRNDEKKLKQLWPKKFNLFDVFIGEYSFEYNWRSPEYNLIFSPVKHKGELCVKIKIGEVGHLFKTYSSVFFEKSDLYENKDSQMCQIGTKTILGKKFKIFLDLEKKLIPVE